MGSTASLAQTSINPSKPSGTLLNDVYGGTQGIMQQINKVKTSLLVNIEKSVFHAIDSIIPLGTISQFAGVASSLSGKIGTFSANFSGLSKVTGFIGSYQSSLQQFNRVLSNPQELMYQYSTPKMNSYQTMLYSPNEVLQKYLPSNLTQSIGKISSASSIALGGSMGGGLFNQLESVLKGQVIQNILQQFPSHINLISPIFKSGAPTQPPTYNVGYRQTSYPTSTIYNGEIQRQPDYKPSPLFSTINSDAPTTGFSLQTTETNNSPLAIS